MGLKDGGVVLTNPTLYQAFLVTAGLIVFFSVSRLLPKLCGLFVAGATAFAGDKIDDKSCLTIPERKPSTGLGISV